MNRPIPWRSFLIAVAASTPVMAANWHYEGTSGFTLQTWKVLPPACNSTSDEGADNALTDQQYITKWCATVDPGGNVFFTAGDARNVNSGNDPCKPGGHNGVTIMKPNGSGGWNRVDVDLSRNAAPAYYLPIGITEMVVGGDGKVYACQNWLPIQQGWFYWPYFFVEGNGPGITCTGCKIFSRLIRINLDGTVDIIKEYSPEVLGTGSSNERWVNRIGGVATGQDGHVYWWLAGAKWGIADNYYKNHVLWRYNTATQTIEESPTGLANGGTGFNNGFDDISQLCNLEYVGKTPAGTDMFVYIRQTGGTTAARTWAPNPMGWEINRHYAYPNEFNDMTSASGHDYVMNTAYDPVMNKLWAAGKGRPGVTESCKMSRWNGVPGQPGMFNDETTDSGDVTRPYRKGIVSVDVWHANGNNPAVSGIPNGIPNPPNANYPEYWVGTMAINPYDSSAWMAWGASDTKRWGTYNYAGTYGPVGPIYGVGPNDVGPTANHGNPQAAHPNATKAAHRSQTVAVTFSGTKVYAVTVDYVDLEFNLFTADNPSAGTGACCVPNGTCAEVAMNVCSAQGGAFQGIGSTCAQTDCRFKVCHDPFADADGDHDVDQDDFGAFQACYNGTAGGPIVNVLPYLCTCFDKVKNNAIDSADFDAFKLCVKGPGVPADPACDN